MTTDSPTPADARKPLLCASAAAALLYLCYFPVSAGALAWVALVPLLALVRMPRRGVYLGCVLPAFAFHLAVLQWVRVADWMMYFAWVLAAAYGALYWPAALAVLRWLDRRTRLPLVVTAPLVWVCLEYVRYGMAGCFVSLIRGDHQHDVPGGFGWYLLGHTQHDFLPAIQIADLTGAYGVSALVAMTNALLFEVLCSRDGVRRWLSGDAPPRQGKRGLLVQGVAVAALVLAALGYGTWRLGQPMTPGPRVALIQTNTPQSRRNDASSPDKGVKDEAQRHVVVEFRALADLARRQRPDLIVTPETSYPGYWAEHEPGKPFDFSQKLADDVAAHLKTAVLLGMSADVIEEDGKAASYNSAILIGPDGHWLGRYDKIHRVPFGEYVPLRWLPFMKWLAPYDYDYEVSPGRRFTRFELGDYVFGTTICYEDTDPAMCRPYGGGGVAEADFWLNVSNDGWFRGSSEHDQHLAICRFRAVENRRGVGRSVNVGISALIDGNGRVLAPLPAAAEDGMHLWEVPDDAGSLPASRWGEFKRSAGVVVGRVPLDGRASFYARHGDWFALGCLALVSLWCAGLFVTR